MVIINFIEPAADEPYWLMLRLMNHIDLNAEWLSDEELLKTKLTCVVIHVLGSDIFFSTFESQKLFFCNKEGQNISLELFC